MLIKVKTEIKVKAKSYLVSLVFGNENYRVEADSVAEGLGLLRPGAIKSACLLRVESGGKKAEIRLVPARLRKLLSSPTWQAIFDKKMNLLLR